MLKSSLWSTPPPAPAPPQPYPLPGVQVLFSSLNPFPPPLLQLVCSSLVNVLNEVTRYECLRGQGLWGLPTISQAWLSHPCHFFLLFQLLADLFVLLSTFSPSSVCLSVSPALRLLPEWLVFVLFFLLLQHREIRLKQTVCVSHSFCQVFIFNEGKWLQSPINHKWSRQTGEGHVGLWFSGSLFVQ